MDRRRSDNVHRRSTNADFSAEAGNDALGGILSVVSHGGAQGTNKYGLLLVLIELAQETEFGEDILLDQLALKSLELYWPMSLQFADRNKRLQQIRSSNRSVAALSVAEQLRSTSGLGRNVSWTEAARHFDEMGLLHDAIRQVGYKLWRDPINRVQKLPGSDSDFLFSKSEEPRRIRLREAAQEALVRHGPLLREMIQHRFVSFVSDVPRNDLTHGARSVHQYLFPVGTRPMPSRSMVDSILDLQNGVSPYSGRPMKVWHVDHVVPWYRVHLSMIENFAVIPTDESLAKSHHLMDPEVLENWTHSQTANAEWLRELASKHQWVSDAHTQLRVLQMQYQAMRPGDIIWGPAGVRPASYVDIANAMTVVARAIGRIRPVVAASS